MPSFEEIYANAESKFDTGEFPAALIEISNGKTRSDNTDRTWNWKFRILEAEILLWQGDANKVLVLLEPDPPLSALSGEFAVRRKLAQARGFYLLGNFRDSRLRILDAQEIASARAPGFLGDIALVRATLLFRERKYPEVEPELSRALDSAIKFSNRMLRAQTLTTLGLLYTAEGLYDKAIDRGTEASNLSRLLHARHLEAAIALNLGWSYLELGDFGQAIPFFDTCEKLADQSGMKSIQEKCLNSLGRIYLNQGNFSSSAAYLKRALRIAKDLGDSYETGLCLNNLALSSGNLARFDDAKKYNQEALSIQRRQQDHFEELRSLLTSAWIENTNKEFTKAEPILHSILIDKDASPAMQWEVEHQLASLYVETRNSSQAQLAFKTGLEMLDRSWESISEDEHKLAFWSWAEDFYTDYIRYLMAQGQDVEALQEADSIRGRILEQGLEARKSPGPNLLSLAKAEAYLRREQQIILTYWLSAESSYLWVITPARIETFVLPSKQEIEGKVDLYQHRVSTLGRIEPTDAAGQELYRILVEPARKLISMKAHVVIIPDGSLGKLNFETLIVPGASPHFWIDDVQIEDASSIQLLINSSFSERDPRNLLAIGDPVEVDPNYRRLEYAHQEIEAAAKYFVAKNNKIISGRDAIPSVYASNRPRQFDIVLFATHGSASETRPLDSAIILSPQADGAFKLYARDIVRERLRARVVIISACYGAGKTTYSGEGLVGLAWAFLRAGAHQVIAGLWNVENRSAAELMEAFFTGLAQGRSTAIALRNAKLKMLHSTGVHRFPYYWASLQLYTGS